MQQSHETYMKVSVSGYADTDTVYACLWNSILSSLFLLGLVLCVRQITTGAYYVPVIVTCLVLPTATLLLSQRQKTRFLLWLIPLCVPVICGILFSKRIINGFILVCNDLFDFVGLAAGRIMEKLEPIKADSAADKTLFIISVIAVLSLVVTFCLKNRNPLVPIAIFAVAFIFSLYVGAVSYVGIAVMLVAVVGTVLQKYCKSSMPDEKGFLLHRCVALLCSLAVVTGVVLTLTPLVDRYHIEGVHNSLNKAVYGKTDLPEGDFSNLGDFEKSGKTMLEVVMSKPESYYLRGFVGSVYTSTGWRQSDGEKLYKNADLFYWLHKEGFYGQSQLSQAAKVTGDVSDSNRMIVKNIGASTKYIYAPYEVLSDKNELLDERQIGDEVLSAGTFLPKKSYTYYALDNQVKRYTQIAAELDRNEERYADYLNNESHYNEYVYRSYTELPDNFYSLMKSTLGSFDKQIGHYDYAKAKQEIVTYLCENMTYSESVSASKKDFVQDFLVNTKSGYSVHFATAATLMFRYFGIPARYVEGYLITPDDVQNVKANTAIKIDDSHAHAWVEFYQDGVGWIPFEVTPPYLDIMQSADDITADTTKDSKLQKDRHDDNDSKRKEQESQSDIDWGRLIFAVVLGLLLIFVIILTAIILVRKARLKMLHRSFETDDVKTSVCNMFSYCVRLLMMFDVIKSENDVYLSHGVTQQALGVEYAKAFDEALDIYSKAKFSEHDLEENDGIKLRAFVVRTENEIASIRSKSGRFIDRHIKHIYY